MFLRQALRKKWTFIAYWTVAVGVPLWVSFLVTTRSGVHPLWFEIFLIVISLAGGFAAGLIMWYFWAKPHDQGTRD